MPAPVTTPENIRIVAAIDGVLEISLLGAADLTFWQERLRPSGLEPTARDARAECLISATDARFHGIRFRELSFSVFVTNHVGGTSRDGAYMSYAINSLRLFAWIERTLFATPYYPGRLDVHFGESARVLGHSQKQQVFFAEMGGAASVSSRMPLKAEMDGWSGPIYLPPRRTGGLIGEKLFYAKLQGETRTYPFDPQQDRFQLTPLASQTALQDFRESGFEPREWSIRPSAQHAKSKTVRRSAS